MSLSTSTLSLPHHLYPNNLGNNNFSWNLPYFFSKPNNPTWKKSALLAGIIGIPLLITGCQTTKSLPITPTTGTALPSTALPTVSTPNANLPNRFKINGKIGMVSPQQSGSAFYTWSQQDNVFAINLAGAMGVGQTKITYDGNIASMISEKIPNDTHTLTARSPEELLQQVAGWQAPISQLPYWIMGKYAPSDSHNQLDNQGRLSVANNSDWTASFSYDGTNKNLPSKIIMKNVTGTKVTLTINHL